MSLKLAFDAFDVVKRCPESALLWRKLCQIQKSLDAAQTDALIASIAEADIGSSQANWLRYGCLDYISGNADWRRRQAELAGDGICVEAIMELLNLNWAQATQHSRSRKDFTDKFKLIQPWRLQQLIAGELIETDSRPLSSSSAMPRIAVYTPQLANMNHGGSALSINLVSLFKRAGIECRLFAAQETVIPVVEAYKGGLLACKQEKLELAQLRLHGSGRIELGVPNEKYSLLARFNFVLQAIDDYTPDLVLFVGMMSPVIHALYGKYPVLAMSIHTCQPSVPADLWLSNQRQQESCSDTDQDEYRQNHFSHRFWPQGPACPVNRSELGIPIEAVALVTSGFRLPGEIRPDWRRHMLELIDRHEHVYWLLVGVTARQEQELDFKHERIGLFPPRTQLENLLATCDIYVNHPCMGGGGVVAMAMEQGIPVLSFRDCDGGNKIGEFAVVSDSDYFTRLEDWITNRHKRKAAGLAQQILFQTELDISSDVSLQKLVQAMEQAIELGTQRLEKLLE